MSDLPKFLISDQDSRLFVLNEDGETYALAIRNLIFPEDSSQNYDLTLMQSHGYREASSEELNNLLTKHQLFVNYLTWCLVPNNYLTKTFRNEQSY